jgi:hypothetical protein
MNTQTTYANSGSCRRAAKKALGADAERGTDFQMEVNEDGRWTWWPLKAEKATPEMPEVRDNSPTREGWLRELVHRCHEELFRNPMYNTEASDLVPFELPKFRIACSWPGGGSPRKRIGECWSSTASGDGATEMMVSPALGDPMRVADVVVHEMVHMYVGTEAGHKGPFRKLAVAIGLEGKMTATVAGERLMEALQRILDDMGDYPHAQLSTAGRKKQSTRLLKVTCSDDDCGCVYRVTAKWVDAAGGAMHCPVCKGFAKLASKRVSTTVWRQEAG